MPDRRLSNTINVTGSTFTNNANTTGDGGAIYCYQGTVTVNDSTFVGNSASPNGFGNAGDGGAIAVHVGTLTVTNSTFENNTAANGGGAIAFEKVGNSAAISDSTFIGNSAVFGGAIYSSDFVGGVTITYTEDTSRAIERASAGRAPAAPST